MKPTRRLNPTIVACAALLIAAACGTKQTGYDADGGQGPGGGGGGGDDGGGGFGDDNSGQGGDDSGAFQGGSGGGSSSGTLGDSGSVAVTATMIDTCTTGAPSGLSASSVSALLAGGSAGSMRFLYPYASTVFPRGLISPTIMWDGASADYVYVHLKSNAFEYIGCLAPTATGQVLLPQDVWVAASAHTSGPSDPFTLSLTTISSGTVTGPISEPLIIAAATLAGSIYYNSYTTKLASNGNGAVLRIIPGQNTALFLGQNGCTGCHAVSANGSRMVATPYGTVPSGDGASYTLTTNGAANPAPTLADAPDGTFVGLYPDGSLYLGNAHPDDGLGGPRPGGPLAIGPENAALYETDTGTAVTNTSIPTGAMMGTFSPDGKNLVFTDTAIGNGNGQGLATMTFDITSRTAASYTKVFQVSDSSTYPGWPFYLPDDGAIIFAIGNQADFSGGGLGLGVSDANSVTTATSDLYILDVASGTSTLLAQAVGFPSPTSTTPYLPYGSADVHHNFYPTVSPVAAGGYFWAFFDSYRNYGNNGLMRQLWGTAIDVAASGHYTTDTSHPPFYLTGQELGTGNHRAFTALDACKSDGSSCSSGFDCCGGFCTVEVCEVPTSPRCSNTGETCSATQKCCDSTNECLAGFCSLISAQ